jgi:type II secretory pathway predicted ATPase ExeA
MDQSHWNLEQSPFHSCLSPRLFYQSPVHEEALARLQFLVEQRRRVGLLMGPSGSGKSYVLEVAAAQFRESGRAVAKISLLGVQAAEMLRLLANNFGLNLDPAQPLATVWRALGDRLTEYRYQQLDTVVLLDDADLASRPVLAQVARLTQYDASEQSRLTLVLSGQQERMGCLGSHLLELADLRIDLVPWDQAETADFLKTSLAQAGCRTHVFADPAVERLQELSHGIPRRVSQLADLALLAAAGREIEQIDAELVDSVYRELSVVES